MNMPSNFIKIIHASVDAITYVDITKISHIVDLKNSTRLHLSSSGDYITSTEAIETILDKVDAAYKATKKEK